VTRAIHWLRKKSRSEHCVVLYTYTIYYCAALFAMARSSSASDCGTVDVKTVLNY
jgi:hypothetical protein